MTGLSDLSCDAFLGGRLHLWQPRTGYRAGVDPVLLAASVPAQAGQRVLELGCGAGVGLLCLGRRVEGLSLCGLELQRDYADLARRNALENHLAMDVIEGDLADPPPPLKEITVDHVIANPPFFLQHSAPPPEDPGRQLARSERVGLNDWVASARRRLVPGGWLHMILRAERLPDLLAACTRGFGSVELRPIVPRAGRPARLCLARARKGARGPFVLHSPLVMHHGPAHLRDEEDYAAAVLAVLREGAALPWPPAN